MRCLWFCLCLVVQTAYADLSALYLTWYTDPCTTMTIQWHTSHKEKENQLFLQKTEGTWESFSSTSRPLEDRLIHTLSLEQLEPNTSYTFRIGTDPTLYRFQTAPRTLDSSVRFVIGGDAYQSATLFRQMNQAIQQQNPLFAVIGGDIAYAIYSTPLNLPSYALKRWLIFLSDWKEQMKTADGRLIPMLLVAGNHDVSPTNQTLFFTLFSFPEKKLYRSLDFGAYLSLLFLDTNHLDPIEGKQTEWLKATLPQKESFPYRLAVYHEGAYPSFYPYLSEIPVKVRTHWCPLFDQFRLTAAFENHSHTYKKTYPLRNHQIDPEGVVYFGDGCWGAKPRNPQAMWYLEKKGQKNHVFLIELSPEQSQVQALDLQGQVFDTFSLSPSPLSK